jgi:hypothetical protein
LLWTLCSHFLNENIPKLIKFPSLPKSIATSKVHNPSNLRG